MLYKKCRQIYFYSVYSSILREAQQDSAWIQIFTDQKYFNKDDLETCCKIGHLRISIKKDLVLTIKRFYF